MNYFLSKTTDYVFDQAIEKIGEALKQEGFGILTEIDMKQTLKSKLDVDIKKYKILGACNPGFAYQALKAEEKIGILLPCNVCVIEQAGGRTEVAIMDPVVAMSVVDNPGMESMAAEVREKLVRALKNL